MRCSIYTLDLTDSLAPMRMGHVDACPKLQLEQRGGAAIRISPDGKFLYCSNRSDSGGRIDWFSLEDPMHPQHVGTVSDGLFFLRDFALSRDGQYLVERRSAGRNDHSVETKRTDRRALEAPDDFGYSGASLRLELERNILGDEEYESFG